MTTGQSAAPEAEGPLTRDIQYWLRELIVRLHRLNDAVGSRIDLRASDIGLLDLLARHGPMSARELSTASGVHPATLTGIVDRLEEGGWVARVPDPVDRRKVRIEALTARGGEMARLYGPMNRSLAAICSGLTREQLVVVRDFLRDAAEAGDEAATRVRGDDR